MSCIIEDKASAGQLLFPERRLPKAGAVVVRGRFAVSAPNGSGGGEKLPRRGRPMSWSNWSNPLAGQVAKAMHSPRPAGTGVTEGVVLQRSPTEFCGEWPIAVRRLARIMPAKIRDLRRGFVARSQKAAQHASGPVSYAETPALNCYFICRGGGI